MSDSEDHDGDGVVDFGSWEEMDNEAAEEKKPLSGRRKKAAQEQKKKNRPGTFGECDKALCRASNAACWRHCVPAMLPVAGAGGRCNFGSVGSPLPLAQC